MSVVPFKRRRRSPHPPRLGVGAVVAFLFGCTLAAGWLVAEPSAGSSDQALGDRFACTYPTHYDGDAIRCGSGRAMRLYAIDAPEMPGSCRRGRICTPGDPYAARDHLASLTGSASVECRIVDADEDVPGFQDADRYGRNIVQCFAGSADLSCAMVRDGYAVERYGQLRC